MSSWNIVVVVNFSIVHCVEHSSVFVWETGCLVHCFKEPCWL